MLFQFVERREFQHAHMGGIEHDERSEPSVPSLDPALSTDTPLIAGDQALETELGIRSTEVVPGRCTELQKLVGHAGADHMHANVITSGVAATIAVEAGNGIIRTREQFGAENVLSHDSVCRQHSELWRIDFATTVPPVHWPGTKGRIRTPPIRIALLFLVAAVLACTNASSGEVGEIVSGSPDQIDATGQTTGSTDTGETETETETAAASGDRPDWLGSRTLATTPEGDVITPLTTPSELVDRDFSTIDTIPPPSGGFEGTISPLAGDALNRSTWNPQCPVGVDELSYLSMSFWGFDGAPHQGEMIVHASVAEDVVGVFEKLYDAQFPIEEMRIATTSDLAADPTGDGNMTTSFVCREVTGGTAFSQHAFGLAIDINPFHNPYIKGDRILPELAGVYADRNDQRKGMIVEGDAAIAAFDAIGWGWGGRWNSLKDYQHFSLNNK